MRRLCAVLLVLASPSFAEEATTDQLLDASQLVVTGKVLDLRDSVEAGRKLALVEVAREYSRTGNLAKTSLRRKLFVSFASDKGAKGAMETGKEYVLFLERRATHGEFHPVLDGAGVVPATKERDEEAATFCESMPVCSLEHREVKSDGKDGKCAACGRKTKGSAFQRCRGCAFKEKKCRVCGKGFKEPYYADLPLIVVRKLQPPLEIEENPAGQVVLAPGQDSAHVPVGGVVGLWKPDDEDPVIQFEGDACEVVCFEDAASQLWAGVRARKAGRVRIQVFATERDTETWLARVVELTIE